MPSTSSTGAKRASRAARTPTTTSRIEQALRESDDFLRPKDLRGRLPDVGLHELHVCLAWLKRCKAADIIASQGETFWFSTPETDTRSRHIAEKVHGGPGSRGGTGARKRSSTKAGLDALSAALAPFPPSSKEPT